MIDLYRIFDALSKEIQKRMPTTEHYLGALPEGAVAPCFLYLLSLLADERAEKHTTEHMLEIELVYFSRFDGFVKNDLEEHMCAIAALQDFNSGGILLLATRAFKFNVSISIPDKQLAFGYRFRFREEIMAKKPNERMENISVHYDRRNVDEV